MDCNEIRERLDVYAWGGLDGPATAVVAKHLRVCAECREELGEIKPFVADLREALRHPLPVDRFDDLWRAIEADRRRDRAVSVIQAWRRDVARRGLAVAAALALCVWLGPKLEAPMQPAVDPAKEVSAAVMPSAESPLVERRNLMEKYLAMSSGVTREIVPDAPPAEAPAKTGEAPADDGEPSAAGAPPANWERMCHA